MYRVGILDPLKQMDPGGLRVTFDKMDGGIVTLYDAIVVVPVIPRKPEDITVEGGRRLNFGHVQYGCSLDELGR